MSTSKGIAIDELPPEARKLLRKQHGRKARARAVTFSKDRVRTYAIRCLGPLADLTPSVRARVADAGRPDERDMKPDELPSAERLNAIARAQATRTRSHS